eukprot:scaffold1194_cov127-Cylindrotheca_fusiformis.AAC.17
MVDDACRSPVRCISENNNRGMPDSPCETVVSHSDDVQESDDGSSFTRRLFRRRDVRYTWTIILGLAGALDVLGTVLPQYLNDENSAEPAVNPYSSDVVSLIAWLDRHNVAVGFAFSVLWFLDAFWKANRAKHKARAKIERNNLMSDEDNVTPNWWKTSSFAYYRSITVQLLCLPVGFYVALYSAIYREIHGEEIEHLDQIDDSIVVPEIDRDGREQYEEFTVRSKKAFIFAILHYFGGATMKSTVHMVKTKLVEVGKKLFKRLFRRAVRNPLKFRRELTKVLIYVRYSKYGFPLYGKFNRIKGLVMLSWKRHQQRLEADTARRARQMIWDEKSPEELKEHAAILIQSAFRARQARKALKAIQIFQAKKEYIAVSKIQHVLRRKLREQRARRKIKQAELKRLEDTDEQEQLSDEQKLRMYELRDELMEETKDLLNRKMLIRPNTRFSVYWKLFFALCLLWELANLAAKPWLQDPNKHGKTKGLPSTLEELVAQKLVPTRVSDLPECKRRENHHYWSQHTSNQYEDDSLSWYCHEPFSTVQETVRDFMALTLVPSPVSEWTECTPPSRSFSFWKWQSPQEPAAWYCKYGGAHKVYRQGVDFFWKEFQVLVGVAYFMDVFITFFTGVFHPKNGILIPKAFFARWITPGLLLQLLVNPYMKTVSTWTFDTVRSVMDYGPVRVYRWNATAVFPVVYWMLHLFVTHVWLKLVEFENQNDLIPDGLLTA